MENTVWFAPAVSDDLSGEARRLLARALGGQPQIEKDPRGRPYLPAHPGWHISLTHTRGAVACAVFDRPVGLDIERLRRISPGLAARYFTESEQLDATDDLHFLEIWTRKEALLKRDGGLNVPFARLETCGDPALTTFWHGGFVLSVCAAPPRHRFCAVTESG